VIDSLIALVCDIKPQVHKNYRPSAWTELSAAFSH
jgi:hypothetical protein